MSAARWWWYPALLVGCIPALVVAAFLIPVLLAVEAAEAIGHRRHRAYAPGCLRCLRLRYPK